MGKRKGRKGFTLVELLVVISIIAMLLSILMPSLSKAREQARAVVCLSRLKQLGLGFMFYVDDYEYIPPTNKLNGVAISGYTFPAWMKELGVTGRGGVTLHWRQMVLPTLLGRGQMNATTSYEKLWEYTANKFSCPSFRPGGWISYTQNADVSGRKYTRIKRTSEIVMALDVGPDLHGGVYSQMWIDSDDHADTPDRIGRRHPKDAGFNVLFVDLSVSKAKDEYDLTWRMDGRNKAPVK